MNVNASDIAKIIQEACPNVCVDESDYSKPFSELGVDSLDIAIIFLNIHEKTGLLIPDADIDDLETVDRIAAYVNARQIDT